MLYYIITWVVCGLLLILVETVDRYIKYEKIYYRDIFCNIFVGIFFGPIVYLHHLEYRMRPPTKGFRRDQGNFDDVESTPEGFY